MTANQALITSLESRRIARMAGSATDGTSAASWRRTARLHRPDPAGRLFVALQRVGRPS